MKTQKLINECLIFAICINIGGFPFSAYAQDSNSSQSLKQVAGSFTSSYMPPGVAPAKAETLLGPSKTVNMKNVLLALQKNNPQTAKTGPNSTANNALSAVSANTLSDAEKQQILAEIAALEALEITQLATYESKKKAYEQATKDLMKLTSDEQREINKATHDGKKAKQDASKKNMKVVMAQGQIDQISNSIKECQKQIAQIDKSNAPPQMKEMAKKAIYARIDQLNVEMKKAAKILKIAQQAWAAAYGNKSYDQVVKDIDKATEQKIENIRSDYEFLKDSAQKKINKAYDKMNEANDHLTHTRNKIGMLKAQLAQAG